MKKKLLLMNIVVMLILMVCGCNSKTTTYYIGDTQVLENIEYTLTDFYTTDSVPSTIGNEYISAGDNNTFVAIKIYINNKSSNQKTFYTSDWKLIMKEPSAEYNAKGYLFQYNSINGEKLQPYEESEYLILFSIPKSVASNSFKIKYCYKDTLFTQDYAYWELHYNS